MKSSSSPFALLLFLGTARKSCQHLPFSLRRGLSLSPLSRLAEAPKHGSPQAPTWWPEVPGLTQCELTYLSSIHGAYLAW